MTEDQEHFKKKMMKTYLVLYNGLSTILMNMSEGEKLVAVRGTPTNKLKNIYFVAKEKEDYEVCGVILKVLTERGEKVE